MAIEVRFKCRRYENNYLKVNSNRKGQEVIITLELDGIEQEVYLDESTAIKLAKTIRTNINLIK